MQHSPSPPSLEQPLKRPLKPILKHTHTPTTATNPLKPALTPAPPPKTRQGDPLWLRIMHTKEHQWRLINTIALHELNLLERSACTQLDALADQLDALIIQTAQLDSLVRTCRAIRQKQNFVAIAKEPLTNTVRLLLRLPYGRVRDVLMDSAHALGARGGGIALGEELTRFREAVETFGEAAKRDGLQDLVAVAGVLERVASLAVEEPDAVICAAQTVVDAGKIAETRRLDIVESVVDAEDPRFVPDPSFVE